jgi:protein-tyrosine-phosphatase
MMYPSLHDYLKSREREFALITAQRKTLLQKIATFVTEKLRAGQDAQLVYICTHNSRRSHLGQVWLQIAAHYYGVRHVKTFSGGTEATAMHTNTLQALIRAGVRAVKKEDGENPVYELAYDDDVAPMHCFSKVYHHETNPVKGFAAIMTCSDAEENCPFIPGVDVRIATTYDDPKISDGTSQQEETYDERCAQIARECLWVVSQVRKV